MNISFSKGSNYLGAEQFGQDLINGHWATFKGHISQSDELTRMTRAETRTD